MRIGSGFNADHLSWQFWLQSIRALWSSQNACSWLLQGGPWKPCHFTFVHIFANYWPIFNIFSPMHSVDN